MLSDHGQAATRPFARVSGGASIEDVVRAALEDSAAPPLAATREGGRGPAGFRAQVRGYRHARRHGLIQRFLTYLERDFARWLPPGEDGAAVRVVAAGPNAFVYFTDTPEPLDAEAIERRHPGLAGRLASHPGVGLVLARGARPVCWWRGRGSIWTRPGGRTVRRGPAGPGGRGGGDSPADGHAQRGRPGALRDRRAGGDVSFLAERGAHAGPSAAEMQTFVLHPPHVALPPHP